MPFCQMGMVFGSSGTLVLRIWLMRLQEPRASAWQEFRTFCKVFRISSRRFFSSLGGIFIFLQIGFFLDELVGILGVVLRFSGQAFEFFFHGFLDVFKRLTHGISFLLDTFADPNLRRIGGQ